MKTLVSLIFAATVPFAAMAADTSQASDPVAQWQDAHDTAFTASEVDLAAFEWIARPVVVFADSPNDPRFAQQMDLLAARAADLATRDVVIITDTDPAAASDIRRKLRPRGFMLVVMAKDGTVALRKPFPWDVREISRAIDKFPLRQQEIRDRRLDPSG